MRSLKSRPACINTLWLIVANHILILPFLNAHKRLKNLFLGVRFTLNVLKLRQFFSFNLIAVKGRVSIEWQITPKTTQSAMV